MTEKTDLEPAAPSSWLDYTPSEHSTKVKPHGWEQSGKNGERPSPAQWQPVFLDQLSKFANVTRAAKAAGVFPSIPYYYRKKDPQFAQAWAQAYEEGVDEAEGILQDHMRNNSKGGVVATIFWLKGRRRSVFGDKAEISGPGGGAIPVTHMLDTMKDQLKKIRADQEDPALAAKNITPLPEAPEAEPVPVEADEDLPGLAPAED